MENWQISYIKILFGQSVSKFTSSILQFAIIWYINAQTGSAFALSLAMLAGFLPNALLGPFLGVFIDKYNRKNIIIISDLAIGAVSLLPFLSSILVGNIPLWVIYTVLFLRSVGAAFHSPSTNAMTPQIVPKQELIRYAGYSQAIDSVSLILSPIAATFLFSVWKLNYIILLDVGGAIFAVLTMLMVKVPANKPIDVEISIREVLDQSKEGLRILSSQKGLMGLVIISSFYSLALMPVSILFPLVCIKYFGGTDLYIGIVETIFSFGLLIGAIFLSFNKNIKNKIYNIVFSCLLMSLSLFISGIISNNQWCMFSICSFTMGISGPFFWSTYQPLLQAGFPEQQLGRVLSLSDAITVIASPVGMLVSGLFSEFFGAQKWFLIASFMTMCCGIACIAIPAIKKAGLIFEERTYD